MASLEMDEHEELPLEEEHGEHDSHAEEGVKKSNKKKRDGSTLRKAPQAPKRFKSSYICFFMAKQPEIKDELGDKATVTEISKRSAQMWRNLPAEERAHWDDVAAKDKQRYMIEKASYTGPWQVPWKRAKKDPSAPKRPMSAFLYYSQGKRRELKEQNPNLKNTEVSRLLGDMWRHAPEEDRNPHIEKEKEEREKYKVAIADWRKEAEAREQQEQKAKAEQAAYMANMYQHQPPPDPHHQHPYDGNMMGHYPGQPPPHMGPPPGGNYGYGGHNMYPPHYSYPVGPYNFPTNGKQPVILGPSGTPRYPPPSAMSYPPQGGPPPPQMQQQQQPQHPPSPYAAGPPGPQGYDMHPHQQHHHQQQYEQYAPAEMDPHHQHHHHE